MEITLRQPKLTGQIAAMPSKSHVHRLLICAALADAPTTVRCPVVSEDMEATVRCLAAMGAQIDYTGEAFHVTPVSQRKNNAQKPLLDCGESGSTMRFLLPVLCAMGGGSMLGHGRLPERPLSPLYEELVSHGARLSPMGQNPLTVEGVLHPGQYTIDGGVSSQFISGLLFALPLLPGTSTITVTGRLESASYVTMTLEALAAFGVKWEKDGNRFILKEENYHSPGNVTAEGDWSNGAFWLAAGALSERGLTVTGLSEDSVQGDKAVLTILENMGAVVTRNNAHSLTVRGGQLHGYTFDGSQIPDLVPILAVVAAASTGETLITGIGRLRLKESDRIATVAHMLTSLGCTSVTSGGDWLKITGGGLTGGTVQSWQDHRIAMAAGIGATVCTAPVTILGAEAVRKSYPGFFGDLDMLIPRDYICTACRR